MVKTSEQMRESSGEKKDIFRIWADSYAAVSNMWEDSYINMYKPWIESTGEMVDKAAELSKEATAEKFKEFYDEWLRTYQSTFGKFYPIPTQKPDRETLEKLMKSAEDSSAIFKSWIDRLDENARKMQELLRGQPDPEKYREVYETWMKTYEKIFEEFADMPSMESTRGVFESYGAVPNIYMKNFARMSKIWKDAYLNLYWPWVNSMTKLSGKMAEISKGDASPEAYKEFYNMWMETYKETYGRLFTVQSVKPSKEMLDSFLRSTDIYLNMYKSWMAVLEKMSAKAMDVSKRTTDPEAYKEFYNTWVSMYERAFEDFSKYMPSVGPMKNMMEPVKNAAKIYTDTFVNISNAWMKSTMGSASRV